jgi:hypothetical protein
MCAVFNFRFAMGLQSPNVYAYALMLGALHCLPSVNFAIFTTAYI